MVDNVKKLVRMAKVGDDVLFVVGVNLGVPEVRSARVVRTWHDQSPTGQTPNLHVFFDGTNDEDYRDALGNGGDDWQTSVNYSAEKTVGTWHWPHE